MNMNPMRWAQGLIEQLPASHDGRNSWLLNHGVGEEAEAIRERWIKRHPHGEDAARATIAKAKASLS